MILDRGMVMGMDLGIACFFLACMPVQYSPITCNRSPITTLLLLREN